MDKTPLVEGRIANFDTFSRHFWDFEFWMIYLVFQNNCVLGRPKFDKLKVKGSIWWSNKSGNLWNIKLGVNTKHVLALPKTKQAGLEHAKKPKEKRHFFKLCHGRPILGI